MTTEEIFDQTTGAVARAACVSVATLRLYTRLGLVPCHKSSDGRRLFAPSAAQRVREILAERLANRGSARAAA